MSWEIHSSEGMILMLVVNELKRRAANCDWGRVLPSHQPAAKRWLKVIGEHRRAISRAEKALRNMLANEIREGKFNPEFYLTEEGGKNG